MAIKFQFMEGICRLYNTGRGVDLAFIGVGFGAQSFAIKAVSDEVNRTFNVPLKIGSAFFVEPDPMQQHVLNTLHEPTSMFGSASEIVKLKATNVQTGSTEIVPFPFGIAACIPFAPPKGKKNDDNVTVTLDDILVYAVRARPEYMIIENLKNYAPCEVDGDDAGVVKECAKIIEKLAEIDYASEVYIVEARDYGAYIQRRRCIIVAFYHNKRSRKWRLGKLNEFLCAMQVGPSLPVLLGPSKDCQGGASPASKKAKTDTSSDGDHMEYYEVMNMVWPPELVEGEVSFHGLSTRLGQVLNLLNTKFPMKNDVSTEMVDLNAGLKKLLGPIPGVYLPPYTGFQSPWKSGGVVPFSNTSVIAVRSRGIDGLPADKIRARALTALEAAVMLGTPVDHLKHLDSDPDITEQFLFHLASISSSPHSFAAVLSATIASVALDAPTDIDVDVEEEESNDEGASSSAAGSD